MPKIIKNGKEYCSASSLGQASEILYDNSESDLISETVQSAIGELKSKIESCDNELNSKIESYVNELNSKIDELKYSLLQ